MFKLNEPSSPPLELIPPAVCSIDWNVTYRCSYVCVCVLHMNDTVLLPIYNTTKDRANSSILEAGVPGGLVGGPRAYQYQFRGFKSHRVHGRGCVLQTKKCFSRNARELELATLDENRPAVGMLNPVRDKK